MNRGDGTFIEVGTALGLDGLPDARGLGASDFDHDGDVDFVINNYRTPTTFHENRVGQKHRWLAVRVRGTRVNRDGMGAEVIARVGERRLVRLVGAGHGFLSQYSLEQLFGLGEADGADEVLVRWPAPNGTTESFGPLKAGQRVTLVEGEGEPVAPAPVPPRRVSPTTTPAGGAPAGEPAPRETPTSLAVLFFALATGPTLLAMWLALRASSRKRT